AVGTFLGAGLYRMGIKQIRGEIIGVGDLFSVTDVMSSLIQYIGIMVAINVVTALLSILPFGFLLAIIIGVATGVLLIFALPLIVDRRLSAVEAVTTSINAAKNQFVMILLFLIVAGIVGCIGAIACGI